MNPLLLMLFSAAILVAIPAVYAETLKSAADSYGVSVGGIVGNGLIGSDARYDNTIATYYHVAGPENALKFPDTEPGAYTYRWTTADPIVNFATSHGLKCRGHTLVWHGAIPTWLTNGNYTTSQLQTILYDHIDTVVGRYADTLPWWDVVNEAISDSGGVVRSTLWYNQPGIGFAGQGTNYIEAVFRRARAADSDVELFYNEYSTETVNTKSTAVFNMVTNFLGRGVPINGVGFQFHIGLGGVSYSSMRQNFQRFNNAGFNLHITEMDVKVPVDTNGVASAADLSTEADVYFNVLGVATAFPRFKVFQTWGFTDAHSWIPGSYPGFGAALPFDAAYNKKPAYWAIYNAFAGQAEKLAVTDVSTGDTASVTNDLQLSAGAGLWFDANAVNDFVTLAANAPYSGTWNIRVGVRKANNCGTFQLATSPAGSNDFSDVGATQDTYSASTTYNDLNLGNTTLSGGGQSFRFTLAGKNASSSNYKLLVDYIRLTPIDCAPAISNLADRTIAQNLSTGPIPVWVDDDFTHAGSLAVSAASSDATLVPAANLVLGGSGVNRTLIITPAANQLGTATITVTVSDGAHTNSTSFLLNVVTPGARPSASSIANRTITEGSSTGPIPFTIGDADTAAAALGVTATSSNPALVPAANIVLSGSDSNRFVAVTPAPNQSGSAIIALTVSDGLLAANTSFTLTVTPVDFPPAIQLNFPADGSHFTAPEPVLVTARVTDPDANATRVEFYANGALLGIDSNSAPYSVLWFAPPGSYMIQAIARDATGLTATSAIAAITVAPSNLTLFATGSVWRYFDQVQDLGTAWRLPGYDDSGWGSGPGQLGFGDNDEATLVISNQLRVTTYFRREFVVTNSTNFGSLNWRLIRDDGAVAYLNGLEVFRSNMPTGTVAWGTFASTVVNGSNETNFFAGAITPWAVHDGTNTIAVEVHQANTNSTDLSFDLELTAVAAPSIALVLAGSSWRYLDTGVAPAANWTTPGFNDAAWSNGYARLGYGGDGEVTTVNYGPNSNAKYITTWFRRAFVVTHAQSVRALDVTFQRDDGLVLYLNGIEALRSNMPTNTITPATLATNTVSGAEETNWFFATLPVGALVPGTNVLAAEVHQVLGTSSDLGFNLQLIGELDPAKPWLDMTRSGGGVMLRWPDWTTAYALESSIALGAGVAWAMVTNTPISANGEFNVTNNATGPGVEFFRLREH